MFYVIVEEAARANHAYVWSYKSLTPAHRMQEQQAAVANVRAFLAADATDTDTGVTTVPTSTLVVLHNLIRPERPIKKFADRETAEKRMKGVLEVLAKPGEVPSATETTEDPMTTKKKRAAKKISGEPKTNGVGRPSAFSGKIIRKLEDKNPRREGTVGFDSWALLKSGMTYEKYLEAGGRRQDLAWDLAHNWVKLETA